MSPASDSNKLPLWAMFGVDAITLCVVGISWGQQVERTKHQEVRIDKIEQAIQLLSAQSIDGRTGASARLMGVETRLNSVDDRLDRMEDKLDRALARR
jgi:hypothetical protein